MRKGDFIVTYTGVKFWPLDPRLEEFQAEDIAHALSLLCRANGHVPHFYSVAQHSIYCAREAEKRGFSKRVQLACLLHDASEAYLSDVTRPVKRHMGQYLKIEEHLQAKAYEAFGLGDLSEWEQAAVKEMDDALLSYELRALMNIDHVKVDRPAENWDLSYQPMQKVEEEFVRRLEALTANP